MISIKCDLHVVYLTLPSVNLILEVHNPCVFITIPGNQRRPHVKLQPTCQFNSEGT